MVREQFQRVLGELLLSNLARPAAHIAVRQQREATKIAAAPGVQQITQDILQVQLRAEGIRDHAAVQHSAKFSPCADSRVEGCLQARYCVFGGYTASRSFQRAGVSGRTTTAAVALGFGAPLPARPRGLLLT